MEQLIIMWILTNTPSLENPGGIATYYAVLKPHWTSDITYLTSCARVGRERKWATPVRLIRDYFGFFRTLRRDPYDVVLINTSLFPKAVIRDAIFFLLAKAFHKRTVLFIRGWHPDFEQSVRRYFLRVFRSVYSGADVVIVLASEFKDKLIEMGFHGKIITETTAVDDEIFSKRHGGDGNRKAQEEPSSFNILFLSRIEESKGIYIVLDTYRILKQRHPEVSLTVAGDGPELAKARQYAIDRGIKGVEFSGYVRGRAKDLALARADVYFFPSYHEGMPGSVLEAMAYGLPIVTRPVGGVADFFADGRMGFASESRDPQVFAEFLERLVCDRDMCSMMGAFNRDYAKERFAASSVAKRLEEVFQSVLSADTNG